jgi:hypothetical protein
MQKEERRLHSHRMIVRRGERDSAAPQYSRNGLRHGNAGLADSGLYRLCDGRGVAGAFDVHKDDRGLSTR